MAEINGMSVINSQIKSGDFSGLYLLGGEEEYLVKQYKEKLIDALTDTRESMNYSEFKGDSAREDEIISIASTMPFFADRRVILVEDSDFFKKGNEKMDAFFREIPDTTVLVFSEKNIDKRCRTYKEIAKLGTVAMFDTPDERTLLIWLKGFFTGEGFSVEDSAVFRLMEYVGNDMNTLYNEAEKLKCYGMKKKIITTDMVENITVNQIEGRIFDMMEALSQRNREKTIRLYSDLVLLREPSMRILYLITRQFNMLLKTKLALEKDNQGNNIASVLKVQPFVAKKYKNQCGAYSYDGLVKRVNMCQETDMTIKTGKMRDDMAVELLVMRLLEE